MSLHAKAKASSDPNEAGLKRIRARMSRIDDMPKGVREMIHEYGLTIVDAFIACGVSNPRHMRHLVETIRAGSYEIGNRTNQPKLKADGK